MFSLLKKKSLLVLFFLILISGVGGWGIYFKFLQSQKENNIKGPIGAGAQQIIEQRYKDGKAVRIYLKSTVSDSQAVEFTNEVQNQPNVNGISYASKAAKSLGPDSPDTEDLQGTIDVFVIDPSQKTQIIEYARASVLVDRVDDISY